MHGHYHCSEHPHQKHKRKNGVIARTAVLLIGILLSLQGCGKPQAGTIYGPSDQEENLYIDVTAQEAAAEEQENRELPEAMIRDSCIRPKKQMKRESRWRPGWWIMQSG